MLRLLLLLCLTVPTWAVTVTKVFSATVTHTTGSVTVDSSTAKIILANVACYSSAPVAPLSNKGNTFVALAGGRHTNAIADGQWYWIQSPSVGTGHTLTNSNCGGSETVFYVGFTWDTSGAATYETGSDLSAADSGGVITLGPITPTVATGVLLVMGASINSTVVGTVADDAAGTFTIEEHLENTSFADGLIAWRQYDSTTPITGTVTYSGGPSSVGYIAAFKLPTTVASGVIRHKVSSN